MLLDELQDAGTLDWSRAVVHSSHVRAKGGEKDRPLARRSAQTVDQLAARMAETPDDDCQTDNEPTSESFPLSSRKPCKRVVYTAKGIRSRVASCSLFSDGAKSGLVTGETPND